MKTKISIIALFLALPAFAEDKPADVKADVKSAAKEVKADVKTTVADTSAKADSKTVEAKAAVSDKTADAKNAVKAETAKTGDKINAVIDPNKPVSQDIANKTSSEKEKSFYEKYLEGIELGAGIGVLGGVNITAGYRIPYNPDNFWKNRFGFRLDYNSLTMLGLESTVQEMIDTSFEEDENCVNGRCTMTEDGITTSFNTPRADATIKGSSFGALVDFHPFGYTWGVGGFRITAGYYVGKTEIGMNLALDGVEMLPPSAGENLVLEGIEMAGQTFDLEGPASIKQNPNTPLSIEPKVTLNTSGPYAGLGWDIGIIPFIDGLKLTFDAGVVFTSPHNVTADVIKPQMTLTGEMTHTFDDAASCSAVAAEINSEEAGLAGCTGSVLKVGTAGVSKDLTKVSEMIDSSLAEKDKAVQDAKEALNDINVAGKSLFPMVKVGVKWVF